MHKDVQMGVVFDQDDRYNALSFEISMGPHRSDLESGLKGHNQCMCLGSDLKAYCSNLLYLHIVKCWGVATEGLY